MIIYQWGLDWTFLPACLQLELAETGAYQKHIRHCPAAPFGLTSSRAAEKRKEQRKQLVNATKMQQGIARGIGGDGEDGERCWVTTFWHFYGRTLDLVVHFR